jgi:hypothetical protein
MFFTRIFLIFVNLHNSPQRISSQELIKNQLITRGQTKVGGAKQRTRILLVVLCDFEVFLKAFFSYTISQVLKLGKCKIAQVFVNLFEFTVNYRVFFSGYLLLVCARRGETSGSQSLAQPVEIDRFKLSVIETLTCIGVHLQLKYF